jgi:hypothetical protein
LSEKSHSFIPLDWPRLAPEESQRRSRAFQWLEALAPLGTDWPEVLVRR